VESAHLAGLLTSLFVMAGYTNPLAAATGGIEFSRLSGEDIKKISVKRIRHKDPLDSLLNPIPGGLHDPALGAIQALDVK